MAVNIHELPGYGVRMFMKEPLKTTLLKQGIDVDSHGYEFESTATGVQLVRRPEIPPDHDFFRVTLRGKGTSWHTPKGSVGGHYSFEVAGGSIYTAVVEQDKTVTWMIGERVDPELGKGFDASLGENGGVPELTYITFRPARPPEQKYDERSWKSEQATRETLVKVL